MEKRLDGLIGEISPVKQKYRTPISQTMILKLKSQGNIFKPRTVSPN